MRLPKGSSRVASSGVNAVRWAGAGRVITRLIHSLFVNVCVARISRARWRARIPILKHLSLKALLILLGQRFEFLNAEMVHKML